MPCRHLQGLFHLCDAPASEPRRFFFFFFLSGPTKATSPPHGRSWGSSFTSAISVPLGFRTGPGVGLQAHSAVFAAVAIATIAAGVSTTVVEVQAIRATCAAFAVVASATTGVSLDCHSAVFAGVAIAIATTGVSRDFHNGPGVGLQAHAAFSGVSIWAHRAVVAVAAAASAATTARACVACTARHA